MCCHCLQMHLHFKELVTRQKTLASKLQFDKCNPHFSLLTTCREPKLSPMRLVNAVWTAKRLQTKTRMLRVLQILSFAKNLFTEITSRMNLGEDRYVIWREKKEL